MAIKLTDLIAQVPREAETRVQRIRDDARSTLQEGKLEDFNKRLHVAQEDLGPQR
jgi:hypothetical protein